MPFLNPMLLWGLLALAVPFLLLLLLHRRKVVLYWAAFEWMQKAVVQRRKRVKIDQLLKLIAKLLLLAAIVLAVARPFLGLRNAKGKLLMVVDRSPSMGVRLDGETRMRSALDLAESVARTHKGGVALMAFDDHLDPLVATFSEDPSPVLNALQRLTPASGSAGAETLFEELQRQELFREAGQVMVIGDFQRHWYGDGARIANRLEQAGNAVPMVWQQVDARPGIDNFAVESIRLSEEGAYAGRPCFISIRVINGSAQPSPERTLSIWVDGERKGVVPLRLAGGETRDVPFTLMIREPGPHELVAELDGDDYPVDDRRFAVVNAVAPPRVLLVAPTPSAGQTYGLETYVSAAIRSLFPDGEMDAPDVLSPLALGTTDLTQYEAVVTVGLPLTAGSVYAESLRHYIRRGGGLLAFLPGQAPDEAGLFGVEGTLLEAGTTVTLRRRGLEGGLASFMLDDRLKPEAIEFDQGLALAEVPERPDLLPSTAGSLATECRVDRGRVLLFGFVPYPGWSNLQMNPNFVQILLRALWRAQGLSGLQSLDGITDALALPGLTPGQPCEWMRDENRIASSDVTGVGDATQVQVPVGLAGGFYRIQQGGREQLRVGLNTDVTDSYLDPVTENDLAPAIAKGLTFAGGDQPADTRTRRDLGLLMAILLVAAVGLEAYAHFFRNG